MNLKLTLELDAEVIEAAEKYSLEHGLSLSQVVESYLKELAPLKPANKNRSSVLELKGILGKAPDDFDYREEIPDGKA